MIRHIFIRIIQAGGLIVCVFLLSLGMKTPPGPVHEMTRHAIERLYPVPARSSGFCRLIPIIVNMEPLENRIRKVTAYNAGDLDQCSGDPCISASGENLCDTLVLGYQRCAANFVPLGTRLHIETLGEYVVVDRMHKRFGQRVDIAMKPDEKERARSFGVQRLRVTVLERPRRLEAEDDTAAE